MINLLDRFGLAHTQVTRLHGELAEIVGPGQTFSAKVELKLTPREMAYEGDMPRYQVTAHMMCRGSREAEHADQPLFTIELVLQTVYQQFDGEAMPFKTFSENHGSLTRQLYPLIHHQLQPVFKQFGLEQVKLPYDLAGNAAPEAGDHRQVH
ncbi:MAG: hypothetical protein HND55_09185 [Pseudomonadota bacterium]|nr:MAG: hypothetical protein HND55_09185 [Pseudomonadota bacterium]